MRYLNYIVPLFIVLLKINTAFANDYPAWWSNEIGKEKIVLPGFQPILISGQNINLGVGRSYHWNNGLLPIKMTARNKEWVVDNRFELEIDGKKEVIQPHSFEIIHSSGHDVELLSVATVSDKLKIHITSKI